MKNKQNKYLRYSGSIFILSSQCQLPFSGQCTLHYVPNVLPLGTGNAIHKTCSHGDCFRSVWRIRTESQRTVFTSCGKEVLTVKCFCTDTTLLQTWFWVPSYWRPIYLLYTDQSLMWTGIVSIITRSCHYTTLF